MLKVEQTNLTNVHTQKKKESQGRNMIKSSILKQNQPFIHHRELPVHNIHQDNYTKLMSSIYQGLEIFWSTKAAAWCKKICHMIPMEQNYENLVKHSRY